MSNGQHIPEVFPVVGDATRARRGQRAFPRRGCFIGIVSIVFATACSGDPETVSDEEMATLDAKLGGVQAEVDAQTKAWREGLEGVAAMELPVSSTPCPTPEEDLSAKKVQVLRRDEIGSASPLAWDDARSALEKISEDQERARKGNRNAFRSNYEAHLARLSEVASPSSLVGPYVLIVEKELEPKPMAGNKFEPGFVEGRLVVWDSSAKAVTCVGSASAESSEKINVYTNASRGVMLDLEIQAKRAGIPKLRALP